MMDGQHRAAYHPTQLVNERGHTSIVACRICPEQPFQLRAAGQILSFHQDYASALRARDSELLRVRQRWSA